MLAEAIAKMKAESYVKYDVLALMHFAQMLEKNKGNPRAQMKRELAWLKILQTWVGRMGHSPAVFPGNISQNYMGAHF